MYLARAVVALALAAGGVAEAQSPRWVEFGRTKDGTLLYDSQTLGLYGPIEVIPGGPKSEIEARGWVRVRLKSGGYRDRYFIFHCESRQFQLTDTNTLDASGKTDFKGNLHEAGTWPPESDIEAAGTTLCDLARKVPAK
jgi:hypothetical protein